MNAASSAPAASPMTALGAAQYRFQQKNPTSRYVGIGFVVALHLLLLWALVSGLGKQAIEVIKKPLEAIVIQEVKLLPPPPPPPPKIIEPPKPQAPKVEAPPPPPFVPPPEVTPPPSVAAPTITAAPEPPPAPPVIAPPPPPAPPAPPAAPAAPARVDIGVACPTQVKPEMPRRALQEGVSGVVRAQITVVGGAVKEVQILAGPRVFHQAVRTAMLQYKCTAADGTTAVQEFEFKLD
jgi:periplasmic protein TonB